MVFKFVAFAALVAAANAGVISSPYGYSAPVAHVASPLAYASPIAHHVAPVSYAAPIAKIATPVLHKTVVADEYDPHPQYNYGYDIQDALTGDSKSQHEQRDGDVVQGSYSLTDADGYRRTVDYTADAIHGFNAVVRREPLAVKVATPVVAKVHAPVAYAAPAHYATPIAKIAAPVAYAAPAHYAAPAYYHH